MTSSTISAQRSNQRDELEFGSYLAHEVRGPLTVILGNALLLQRRGSADELTRTSLQDIREQAEKLNRIVEGLLSLTGTHPESEPLDTRIVVESVVGAFRKLHPTRPLCLIFKTDSMAVGVRSYVEEILENLLANADKYSPEQEPITVEVSGTCSHMTIIVEDKGSGIDAKDQQRIFDLFVRLGQTEAIAGHGIGLALSTRMAEAMDGRLRYKNASSGGSLFSLTLPAQKAAVAVMPSWLQKEALIEDVMMV